MLLTLCVFEVADGLAVLALLVAVLVLLVFEAFVWAVVLTADG